LRKLSLKAEKNWHQNNGAKRRDFISAIDIGPFLSARAARLPSELPESILPFAPRQRHRRFHDSMRLDKTAAGRGWAPARRALQALL
jgi:hypothetical protein